MKESKEYSKKIQKLYRSLKQKFPKPDKVHYEDPVEAVVFAIISEYLPISETEAAIKRIEKSFVDFNDLRVALTEEMIETLGGDRASTRQIATNLSTALGAIFNAYYSVNLEDMKKNGKRPAKQALEGLEGISDFVVDYCMLTALDSHAIPLTKDMLAYLKDNECVHCESDEQEIKGFLTRQITAHNAYEFYYLLRKESEQCAAKPDKKKEAKKTDPETTVVNEKAEGVKADTAIKKPKKKVSVKTKTKTKSKE